MFVSLLSSSSSSGCRLSFIHDSRNRRSTSSLSSPSFQTRVAIFSDRWILKLKLKNLSLNSKSFGRDWAVSHISIKEFTERVRCSFHIILATAASAKKAPIVTPDFPRYFLTSLIIRMSMETEDVFGFIKWSVKPTHPEGWVGSLHYTTTWSIAFSQSSDNIPSCKSNWVIPSRMGASLGIKSTNNSIRIEL